MFVWMNLVYALAATPAGILSDRVGRLKVVLGGLAALTVADLTLASPLGLVAYSSALPFGASTWAFRKAGYRRSWPIPRLKACEGRPSVCSIC